MCQVQFLEQDEKRTPDGRSIFYGVLFQTEYNRWAVSIILYRSTLPDKTGMNHFAEGRDGRGRAGETFGAYPGTAKKGHALAIAPRCVYHARQDRKIIYIGKAKALKNRVSQYFGSEKNHDKKVRQMVSNVEDFEYILTDSEFEALVLECSLIKQHTQSITSF